MGGAGLAESLLASPRLVYTGYWLPDGSGLVQRNPATRIMVIQNLPALVARLRDARD